MPEKRIPEARVRALWRAGHGPKEIADILRDEDYIVVTPDAISNWRRRAGLPPLRETYPELLPWAVAPEHQNLYVPRMLRLEARTRKGEALPEREATRLAAWKQRLEEEDAVVHYDRETDQGWWLVPRRAGIDEDLVRDPAVEDEVV